MIEILNAHISGAVGEYVGRGSPLGNIFPIVHGSAESSRDAVCDKYEILFADWIQNGNERVMAELNRLKTIYEQTGSLKLRCFCVPQRCHVQTIKRWIKANAFDSEDNF